ncbi:hypothetical protein O181_034767 [Austropuccinia psidii MF-1]|uniref:Uncharacterized protein n=1 Tax=Austropuccinia psidii MF-1 TaxID=1389203 RepID=A0A9Q3D3X6_9BASI|nr:hypothetical protein [Austropuccinia psidii MF-1]
MTRDYGSRRIQAIRLCTSRVWGHNSFYSLLKVFNVALQDPLGPQSTIQDFPFLDGPGPLSMGPGHIEKIVPWAFFWTHGPPQAQRICSLATIIVPTDRGFWTTDHRDPKRY